MYVWPKCMYGERMATENICQKFYSFERKGKQYLLLNFDLSLSSFRVKSHSWVVSHFMLKFGVLVITPPTERGLVGKTFKYE